MDTSQNLDTPDDLNLSKRHLSPSSKITEDDSTSLLLSHTSESKSPPSTSQSNNHNQNSVNNEVNQTMDLLLSQIFTENADSNQFNSLSSNVYISFQKDNEISHCDEKTNNALVDSHAKCQNLVDPIDKTSLNINTFSNKKDEKLSHNRISGLETCSPTHISSESVYSNQSESFSPASSHSSQYFNALESDSCSPKGEEFLEDSFLADEITSTVLPKISSNSSHIINEQSGSSSLLSSQAQISDSVNSDVNFAISEKSSPNNQCLSSEGGIGHSFESHSVEDHVPERLKVSESALCQSESVPVNSHPNTLHGDNSQSKVNKDEVLSAVRRIGSLESPLIRPVVSVSNNEPNQPMQARVSTVHQTPIDYSQEHIPTVDRDIAYEAARSRMSNESHTTIKRKDHDQPQDLTCTRSMVITAEVHVTSNQPEQQSEPHDLSFVKFSAGEPSESQAHETVKSSKPTDQDLISQSDQVLKSSLVSAVDVATSISKSQDHSPVDHFVKQNKDAETNKREPELQKKSLHSISESLPSSKPDKSCFTTDNETNSINSQSATPSFSIASMETEESSTSSVLKPSSLFTFPPSSQGSASLVGQDISVDDIVIPSRVIEVSGSTSLIADDSVQGSFAESVQSSNSNEPCQSNIEFNSEKDSVIDRNLVTDSPSFAEDFVLENATQVAAESSVLKPLSDSLSIEMNQSESLDSTSSKARVYKRRNNAIIAQGEASKILFAGNDKEFLPEMLFEYQWPPGKNSELWMIQEQVSEYLDIKSFRRKYADLTRRPIEMEERIFLREKEIVTETQCDLGLNAIRCDEIHELMSKDYPDKYTEYAKVLQEREKNKIAEKHKNYSNIALDKNKIKLLRARALKSSTEYNTQLMRERREERRVYFDLQTNEVHYPLKKRKVVPPEATKIGAYPVAVLPGQFTDGFKCYSNRELSYLPVGTCLTTPAKNYFYFGDESDDSDSDDSDSSSSSSDSASETEDTPSMPSTPKVSNTPKTVGTPKMSPKQGSPIPHTVLISRNIDSAELKQSPKLRVINPDSEMRQSPSTPRPRVVNADSENRQSPSIPRPRIMARVPAGRGRRKRGKKFHFAVTKSHLPQCYMCRGTETRNSIGKAEEFITCTECGRHGHPSCLELSNDLLSIVKTYAWQCMECKKCMECLDPNDEEQMMFCDRCDRGYHTFCIGLKELPTGRWECKACTCHLPPNLSSNTKHQEQDV